MNDELIHPNGTSLNFPTEFQQIQSLSNLSIRLI